MSFMPVAGLVPLMLNSAWNSNAVATWPAQPWLRYSQRVPLPVAVRPTAGFRVVQRLQVPML